MEDIFSIFVQLDVSPLSSQSCADIKVENVDFFVCMHTVFDEGVHKGVNNNVPSTDVLIQTNVLLRSMFFVP